MQLQRHPSQFKHIKTFDHKTVREMIHKDYLRKKPRMIHKHPINSSLVAMKEANFFNFVSNFQLQSKFQSQIHVFSLISTGNKENIKGLKKKRKKNLNRIDIPQLQHQYPKHLCTGHIGVQSS